MDHSQVDLLATIAIAAILPFVFNRSRKIRVLKVALIGGAVLYWGTSIMVAHRLVLLGGYRHFNVKNYEDFPDAFLYGVNEYNRIVSVALCALIALIASLAMMVILAIRESIYRGKN